MKFNEKTLLCFDMDGLLVDTESLYYKSRQATLHRHGFAHDIKSQAEYAGEGWRNTLANLIALAEDERLGRQLFDEALDAYDEMILAGALEVKPGVVEVLDYCQANNLTCAVTSSGTPRNISRYLYQTDLGQYFAFTVSGDDVKEAKPAPDIYTLAAKRGGVEVNEALAFEDSEAGVASAYAAGMATVLVPDIGEPSLQMRKQASLVLEQIDQVLPYLAKE